jgi:hypothetical protein
VPTRKLLLFAAVLLFAVMATRTNTSGAPKARYDVLPSRPTAGELAKLSATRSSCDRRPCTYRWARIFKRGERRGVQALGRGQVLSYRFRRPGTELVRLRVTNRRGQSSSTVKKIVVKAPIPTAGDWAAGPPPAVEGVTLREPDGGSSYFSQFSNHGAMGDPSYFPLWLWCQYNMTSSNIAMDKSLGFNG